MGGTGPDVGSAELPITTIAVCRPAGAQEGVKAAAVHERGAPGGEHPRHRLQQPGGRHGAPDQVQSEVGGDR